jgi:hypothetical protein
MGLLVSPISGSSEIIKLGLTTVDIIVFRGHSLNHDHAPGMAFEEIVNEGNEHDDSSWRGNERKSG